MRYFIFYLIFINIVAFVIYGYDKVMAKLNKRRIRELTLFNLALIGGAYGAFFGMILFNHKTKINRFIIINMGMMLFYGFLIYYFGRYVWN